MFDNRVIAELKKVIGWANYWDDTEIPNLSASLTATESGMTYQSFYPALVRLDYIQAMLPSNRTLEEYLDTIETQAINTALNKIVEDKKLGNYGKDIIKNTILYQNRVKGTAITNEGRFVGIEIDLNSTFSIEVVLNRIGLYLNGEDADIKLYLFNSLQDAAIADYNIDNLEANTFTWLEEQIKLNSNLGESTDGGVWYIGYYQDDLAEQAVRLSTFNWKNGYCGGCSGRKLANDYKTVSKYVTLTPFYIAQANVPSQGTLFDPEDIIYTYDNNWGLNINLSVRCDISQYLIDNRDSLKDLIGKQVVFNVLQSLVSSSQVSGVEQNVQPLALRALEGAIETKQVPYMSVIDRAVKATNLDQGNNHSDPCLPCAKRSVKYTNL